MKITLVGRGSVGGGLGQLSERARHQVTRVGVDGGDVSDAKSLNVNATLLYPRLGEPRARPSNLWSGDAEAREVVEQLNRDVGYDPVPVGRDKAAARERAVELIFAIGDSGLGPFYYRMAPPELP